MLKPPPNHWRWDQINFVFSEMGLEMPTAVEEKKLEEGEKEPVQMRGRVEQTGIVDWRLRGMVRKRGCVFERC